jgi:hypothetical protein
MADDIVLHPTERARRVREAALDAGRRLGWPVPEGLLSRIEAATAGLRLGQADSERVAAAVVERARQEDLKSAGPTSWEASDRQANRAFRIIFGAVVHDIAGLPSALASREEDASAGDTGARFDAMYTGTDWSSEAGQRYMRDYARRCGMGWAGDHPDLLRMGPAAIQALRDANFRRESFRRLRDAGFDRREAARLAVDISRYATRHGLDANRMAEEVERSVRVFGGDNPHEQERWRGLIYGFYTEPENTARREALDRALTEMETHGTPEQQEQARRQREMTRRREEARAELTTATVAASTETAEARRAREAREEAAAKAAAEARAREEAAAKEAALLAEALGEAPAKKGPATVPHEASAKKEPTPGQEVTAKKDPAPEAAPIKLATRSP